MKLFGLIKTFIIVSFAVFVAANMLVAGEAQNGIPAVGISFKQRDTRPTGASGWGPEKLTVPFQELDRVLTTETKWSKATNQINAGIFVVYPPGRHTNAALYCVLAYDPGTNGSPSYDGVSLPDLLYRYRLDLSDDKGDPVTKTKWGRQFGGALQSGLSSRKFAAKFGYDAVPLANRMTIFDSPIILGDVFSYSSSGTFHLDIEVRLARVIHGHTEVSYFPLRLSLELDADRTRASVSPRY